LVIRPVSIAIFWDVRPALIQSKQASLEAERAVTLFHQRLESAQYDAIYGDAAPDFQVSIQPAALSKYLAAIHEKMGACQARHSRPPQHSTPTHLVPPCACDTG